MIIGKLIPAATGLERYRRLEIEPTEPIAASDAGRDGPARRGRARRRAGPRPATGLEGFSFGNGGDGEAFGEELADLALPPADDDKD